MTVGEKANRTTRQYFFPGAYKIAVAKLIVLLLFINPNATAEDESGEPKRSWSAEGTFSALSSNGSSITGSLYGSLVFKRHSGKKTYILETQTERFSERILVDRIQGEEVTDAQNGNMALSADDQRYTVSNISGRSQLVLSLLQQRKPRHHFLFSLSHETNKAANLKAVNRIRTGYRYDFRNSDTETLAIEATIGVHEVQDRLGESFEEAAAGILLSYRSQLGKRSEFSATLAHDMGDRWQASEAQLGFHFWMSEFAALALVNTTVRYPGWLERPQFIESGSDGTTAFYVIFKKRVRR